MINFDKLPTSNGGDFSVVADVYLAHIEKAEMRTPKPKTDESGFLVQRPDYLSLQYRLTRHDGKKAGVMFDMLVESEKQAMLYKLSRFLQACGIPLKGQMELKDLANLVLNKEIVVDTKVDESSTQPRLQVDLWGREAYYPKSQFDEIWKLAHPEDTDGEFVAVPDNEEVPDFMNAPENNSEEDVEY